MISMLILNSLITILPIPIFRKAKEDQTRDALWTDWSFLFDFSVVRSFIIAIALSLPLEPARINGTMLEIKDKKNTENWL